MPIEGSAGTLDIENATLRSNAIAVLTNLVTGNDRVRESGAPALEVYGDPSNGGNEARLEMVSNTATVSSSAFTRLTSNAGVLSVKTGTDASDNGTITFGGFANERMRIGSDGNVGIGTTNPSHGRVQILCSSQSPGGGLTIRGGDFAAGLGAMWVEGSGSGQRFNIQAYKNEGLADPAGVNPSIADVDVYRMCLNPKGGNVGIGTTSPGAPLEVHGADLTGQPVGTTGILSRHVAGEDGVLNIFGVQVSTNEEILGLQTQIDGRAWATDINAGWNYGNDSRYNLILQPYKGRVGIGTTNPASILHVEGSANSPITKRDTAAATNTYNYILNAPPPGTTGGGAALFINGSTRTDDGNTYKFTLRNDSGSMDIGTRSETLVSSHNTAPEPYNANQKNVDIMLNNGSIWMSPYTGRHRDLGSGTGDWNQFIGKHYLGRILTGIQIENKSTNSNGDTGYYSNLLHFRAHDHGIYGGSVGDITMTVRGDKVGVRTQEPEYTLEVNGSLFYSSGGLNGSDDRIKYNEENITNALDIIGKLKPQKYEKIMAFPSDAKGTWIPTDENWETVKNAETKPWEGFTYGNEFGFIAQDVRNIPEVSFLVSGSENKMSDENISPDEYHKLPEEEQSNYTQKFIYESNAITLQEYTSLTLENRENYTELYSKRVETQTPLGLNYQGIFVVAVKAIQELKSKNEDLQAEKVKVATLETQVADLLARVQTLEGA